MKDIQHNGQKIPKGQSEAVNLRYQRGNQKRKSKIPKGQLEAVNRKKTDNTMNRKKNKQLSTKHYT